MKKKEEEDKEETTTKTTTMNGKGKWSKFVVVDVIDFYIVRYCFDSKTCLVNESDGNALLNIFREGDSQGTSQVSK